jgi:hypothetical protein
LNPAFSHQPDQRSKSNPPGKIADKLISAALMIVSQRVSATQRRAGSTSIDEATRFDMND